MNKYYMLEVRAPEERDIAQIGENLSPETDRLHWYAGQKFDQQLPEPLQFRIDPFGGDYIPDFFAPPVPLMSTRMFKLLQSLGVDNIQHYTASLVDTRTPGTAHDYLSINILGLIKCANLNESACDIDDPDVPGGITFDSLVIDESKIGGSLIFRLFEAPQGIVVHESIKKSIEFSELNGIVLISPEQWSG